MKVLVIDDEPIIRDALIQMLNLYCENISNIKEATGVADGLEKIKTYQPDLIFLDVEMGDGTGFDLVGKLVAVETPIIFITAHNKYAVDAFKFCAIDFLTKPIDPEELIIAFDKAKKQIKNADLSAQFRLLQQLLQNNNEEKKIILKDSTTIYFIKISNILNCIASGSYTDFYLLDGSKITVSKPLKEYEQMLKQFKFIRSHHSHLVNMHHIQKLDKQDGGSIVLNNGSKVPISQRKWDQVIKLLGL